MSELHFFDPGAEVSVFERRLPHWMQAGVLCFITWRTNDSIPQEVLQRWQHERRQWLRLHGINPLDVNWRQRLLDLSRESREEFYRHFSKRWHDELDAGHGACVLKSSNLSKIVADSLLTFDGDRYDLTDFVVMPNHVHLLAAFRDEDSMLVQCENWKHYQAVQINRVIGTSGRFWQQDGFDHLVRSESQFEHFRRYIADNPRKGRVLPANSVVWSKKI